MRFLVTKIAPVVMAVIAVMTLFSVNVSAAEEPTGIAETVVIPRLNNGASAQTGFSISANGTAYITCIVRGTDGLTTDITIEVQLQRKTLLWWSDVDGGYWSDSFSDTYGSISDSIQLTKTGKYRAVFTVTVSGTGGADDVIEDTLTYEYE